MPEAIPAYTQRKTRMIQVREQRVVQLGSACGVQAYLHVHGPCCTNNGQVAGSQPAAGAYQRSPCISAESFHRKGLTSERSAGDAPHTSHFPQYLLLLC